MIKTIVAASIIASTSAQVVRHNIRGGVGNAFGRKQRDLQQLSMITEALDASDIPEKEDILDTIPEVPEDVKEETAGKINDALEDVDLSDVPEITVAVDGVDVSNIQESVPIIEGALEDSNIDIPEEVVEKTPLTEEEKEELVAQLMVLCIGAVMKENKTEQEQLVANACCSGKDADPMLGMMCTFYN